MILLLLGVAVAGESRLAGLTIEDIGRFGLGIPDFTVGMDSWRAPAPGGWVVHAWNVDAALAHETFLFSVATVQRPLSPLVVAGAEEARGDFGLAVARRANVVVTVRGENAPLLAAALLAAEVAEPATPWTVASTPAAMDAARDAFGRLTAAP